MDIGKSNRYAGKGYSNVERDIWRWRDRNLS
jgi:hypothetical protein